MGGPGGTRVLMVKVAVMVTVGGGRRSLRSPAELGPPAGAMNACRANEGAGWWSSCRNAKGLTLETKSGPGTACDVQLIEPKSSDNGKQRCGRKS